MMWTKRFNLLAIAAITSIALHAQPAPPQKGSVLILGAHAHLGNGTAIEQSAVGFKDGVIDFVGTANRAPRDKYDEVIEASGKHLYPGFIAANTTLGVSEIDAVRATRDYNETGEYNPNVRTLIAYNPESVVIPTTVRNGVLLAQITPRGGRIMGTSSVVQLDAWNWEDAVVRADDGVHINWPSMVSKTGWYGDFGKLEANKESEKELEKLNRFFADAKAYCEAPGDKLNLRLQAMCGVLKGSQNLYIHADRVKDIAAAIHFSRKHNITKMVIVGGYDAHLIPEMFREHKCGLMLGRVHALPQLPGDPIELPYRLPALLRDNGVSFGLSNHGPHERMLLRNTPFNGGTAVAHGLLYEQAVQAMSLDLAEILGIADRYGSLEVGKSATLFLSDGDALDVRGNQLTHAFIDGRFIVLNNRQEELFERFKRKYSK